MLLVSSLTKIAFAGRSAHLIARESGIKGRMYICDKNDAQRMFGDVGTFNALPVVGYPETFQLHERFVPLMVFIDNETTKPIIFPTPYIIEELNASIVSTTFLRNLVQEKQEQTWAQPLLKTIAILSALSFVIKLFINALNDNPDRVENEIGRSCVLELNVVANAAIIMFLKKSWNCFVQQKRLIKKLTQMALDQEESYHKILPNESYQAILFADSYKLDERTFMKDSYALVYGVWGSE